MIVVVSLNTAIDRTVQVSNFTAGRVHRSEAVRVEAGGKGLNVARTVRRLGRRVRVVGFLGGAITSLVEKRCADLGIEQYWVPITGESRTCVIIADPGRGEESVINEPGPVISPAEVGALRDTLNAATTAGDLLCLSGSAPPGVPEQFYAEIVLMSQQRGVRVLVDVSGQPLRLAWEAGPWSIKPNWDEYCTAFDEQGDPEAAAAFLSKHTDHALLSLGSEGVLHAHDCQVSRYRPPDVATVNAVGCGDALVAGFLAGIDAGRPLEAAIRQGVACGASNARRFEPAIGGIEEIRALAAGVEVQHR